MGHLGAPPLVFRGGAEGKISSRTDPALTEMTRKLVRYYGLGDLHFLTFSCYCRKPLLGSAESRDLFLNVLERIRKRHQFLVVGHVVMPEHVHLLLGEPSIGTLSTVLQVLKEGVSRELKHLRDSKYGTKLVGGRRKAVRQLEPFWLKRFYDFNVHSSEKRTEKLEYMHWNPVKRGLVGIPADWRWSSCLFYEKGIEGAVRITPIHDFAVALERSAS
jgi:putative transposase